MSVNREQSESQ